MTNSGEFKHKLISKCNDFVNQRIENAKAAMNAAQQAANEESKSSAGDKYNTVRALMQIETDKHARQLIEAQKLFKALDLLNIEKKHNRVDLGSLVYTNSGIYFLAISLGKLSVDEKELFVISAVSPIGKLLLGKMKDDTIEFNGRTITISEIY